MKKKHDHRQSIWVLGFRGGYSDALLLWCYQCGAWRSALPGQKWNRPVGIGGKNPAMARLTK